MHMSVSEDRSHLCELPVEVIVDPETGIWMVDGQPMILQPRHAWVGAHKTFEETFGLEVYRKALFDATYEAARIWCDREATTFDINGVAIFDHYMKRMGQRGMAQISVEHFNPEELFSELRVSHSVYVAEYGASTGRKTCYMFEGAFAGGMESAFASLGHEVTCRVEEVQCGSEGAEHCRFEVTGF